jgi:hypothetical protein
MLGVLAQNCRPGTVCIVRDYGVDRSHALGVLALKLLGCFKSSRNFFSRYFFHEVPKETHNIFKDFEDEMTSPKNFFFRKFTLVPPYVH